MSLFNIFQKREIVRPEIPTGNNLTTPNQGYDRWSSLRESILSTFKQIDTTASWIEVDPIWFEHMKAVKELIEKQEKDDPNTYGHTSVYRGL